MKFVWSREGGEYNLLVHHIHEELVQWGLSSNMVTN
jgi:hypothetical protein